MLFLVCEKARALYIYRHSKSYHTSVTAHSRLWMYWAIFVLSTLTRVYCCCCWCHFYQIGGIFAGELLVLVGVSSIYVFVCIINVISVSRMIDFNFSMRVNYLRSSTSKMVANVWIAHAHFHTLASLFVFERSSVKINTFYERRKNFSECHLWKIDRFLKGFLLIWHI